MNRYHYQYRTYVPSPPPGYHVEDLPYPAAHESGRQPELHAILVQQDPVRFQPISANVGQPELVLAPPPPVPVEPARPPAAQLNVSLWMRPPPIRPQRDLSVPYTRSPSPKDDRRCLGQTSSNRPRGSGGGPLLLPPLHPTTQIGE